MITCIGFVPLYSGIRLSLERNDANIDLLVRHHDPARGRSSAANTSRPWP